MGSREDKSSLPPLIDFGEDDNAAPPSAGTRPIDHVSSNPLCDPFFVFELPYVSPTGSSSSGTNSQPWNVPHSAAGSLLIDQWDSPPTTARKTAMPTTDRSDFCTSSTFSSGSRNHMDMCALQEDSSGSISHPHNDLLSSPDVSSHRRRLDIESSPCVSSLSNQTPPLDRLPLQAMDSMLLNPSRFGVEPFFKGSDSANDSYGLCNCSSFDSPPSVSKLSSDSSPHTSQDANDDLWAFRTSRPVAKISEATHLPSRKNGPMVNEQGTKVPEDTEFTFVESTRADKLEQSQANCEELQAVGEDCGWPSEDLSRSYQHEGIGSNDFHFLQDNHSPGQDNILLQQNTARLQEPFGSRIGRLREFKSAGKGVFKAPDRDEDGPVAFELRPQPFKDSLVQPTVALACTDTLLWLACEQGFIVWDIPSSFRSSCDGRDNIKGDEDAAAYSKLMHGLSTTCLFADNANHLVWSGHKDGKVRAWPISMEQDSGRNANKKTAIFAWQAHQTPVLAIVVSSYGELWTGSESGSLRVWPKNAITQAFSSPEDSRLVAASFLATSYIDLKARGLASGASSLVTIDMRFLIAEHSQCRVWSGGSTLLALWDARTKELLKVFGPNADAEFLSPSVSPVREIGRGEEVKINVIKPLKKEKSQAALSFFQRSRNAVIGAADAVLRATVGQSIDDSKRIEALVSASDGSVWAGFANGRLGQWDNSGNWLADYRYSSTAVRCMLAFGNRIFVGYADGVIHTLATTFGKLMGAWRAHRASIARLASCNNHLFTLADNGCLRGWLITSPSGFDKTFHQRMIAKESNYLRQENLKILAGTWNVGQEKASFKSLTAWLEQGSIEASIVAIGLQEIEMGAGALAMAAAKETVGLAGSINGQWWLDSIEDVLNEKKQFIRVGSRQLAGLLLGVWVTKEVFPYIGGVDVSAVACGFGRAFGNKGAVAVKMMVFRRTICVVNCHFAAHMDGVAKRNADFDHIYNRMSFGRSFGAGLAATSMTASAVQIIRANSMRQDALPIEQADNSVEKDNDPGDASVNTSELSEADLLIWVGDFNYRLADVSYTEALRLVQDKKWEELIKKDQLRLEMKAGRVFQGMREAYIMFQPTYKFDKGSTELGYDSSDKRRIPAWCDRVLYRDSFFLNEVVQKLGCARPIAASAFCYEACMEAIESDHKPVSCLIDVQVAVVNEAARRWEYGRFLRTDPEALALQKQINTVPETVVHPANLVLIKQTKEILEIRNDSAEEMAFFSIHLGGEGIQFSNQQGMEQRQGTGIVCAGLPVWLQVLPALGMIQPRRTVEVEVQCAAIEGLSSRGASDPRQHRTAVLVVNVKGFISATSKQHQVKIFHSLSESF